MSLAACRMADLLSPKKRSALMSRVRTRDTKPELVVRSCLHQMGFRFRLHQKTLPGSPDIVLPRYRTAIFVHGCFWHRHTGCTKTTTPKTRTAFWKAKFDANVRRDRWAQRRLTASGWTVVTIWECQTRDRDKLSETLRRKVKPNE
jgi:DNA mismatch endonuclease, patch repair protein